MTTKMNKMVTAINDQFSDTIGVAFNEKFQRKIETRFNIFSMQLISTPADEGEFTPEQHAWITSYSDGYSAALNVAQAMAMNDELARNSR
jgi:hypothetical protein